jgi:hypothetical protein
MMAKYGQMYVNKDDTIPDIKLFFQERWGTTLRIVLRFTAPLWNA